MLQAIRKANPGSDFIYVVDTRPKVSVAVSPFGCAPLQLSFGGLDRGRARGCLPLRLLRSQGAPPLCTISTPPLGGLLSRFPGSCVRASGSSDIPPLCWVHSACTTCVLFSFIDHAPKISKNDLFLVNG